MTLFDTQLINKDIDEVGETITVRTLTKSSYSDWGDATESTSDATGIKAVINVMSQVDEYVKEGIFKAGDIVFFFKSDASNISRGNRIQYNSVWYEIVETIERRIAGSTYIIMASVKKI